MSQAPGWMPHAPPDGCELSGQEVALAMLGVPRILLDGGRGGGKTEIAFARFTKGLGLGPEWSGLILRQHFKEFENDITPKLERFLGRHYPPGSKREARFYRSTKDYFAEWKTGERLSLRHVRTVADYWAHHGSSKPFQFWDEGASWRDILALLDMFRPLMRSTNPDVVRLAVQLVATNPYGPGAAALKEHFVRDLTKRAEVIEPDPHKEADTRRARIFVPLAENRALLTAQPDYVRDTIAPIGSEAVRRAWSGGIDRWDQTVGGYFSRALAPSIHYLAGRLVLGPDWRYRRGFDWGFSKPSACVFGAIALRDQTFKAGERAVFVRRGSLVVFAEWYPLARDAKGVEQYNKGRSLSAREQGAELARASREHGVAFSGCVADPSIFPEAGHEKSIYQDLASGAAGEKLPLSFSRADNVRVAGWLGLMDLLAASVEEAALSASGKGHSERQSLYIHVGCRHLIRTLEAITADEKSPDDVDSNAEDHLLDALRYLSNSTGANQVTPGTLRTH